MKVKFVDSFFAREQTMGVLNELFENVEISDDPDFVFCSVDYKAEHMNYDCPRIMVIGENIVPDFNCIDYAVGFNYMNFEDRYLRVPLYNFYVDDYKLAIRRHIDYKRDDNKKFCNFVYSNGRNAIPERDSFFADLSKYKQVDSGGRHLNNIGGSVDDKREFQKQYKFSIAFENAVSRGYTTEKIIQAFSAGTIPIYYGNPLVAKEFNSKAFINCHEFGSFDEVIDKVKEIDSNPDLYDSMMREPIFTDIDDRQDSLKDYRKFIYNICSQESDKAIRRCDDCWGGKIQREKKRCYRFLTSTEGNGLKARVIRKLTEI